MGDAVAPGFLVFGRPPAAVITVADGGNDEGPRAIAVPVDAMLDERGDVLVGVEHQARAAQSKVVADERGGVILLMVNEGGLEGT